MTDGLLSAREITENIKKIFGIVIHQSTVTKLRKKNGQYFKC
jgi:hypothetical protein